MTTRNILTKEEAISILESVWNYIAMKENKHWPDKEDLAGGSVWKTRQNIADLLHLLRNERN